MKERGSQRRADKWTVMICAERFLKPFTALVVAAFTLAGRVPTPAAAVA
jgi:hypothetical protein